MPRALQLERRDASLGFALDAIEAEKDPKIEEEIAWGIKDAEAVTAHLDDRVLAVTQKLAADPKTETAASYVFSSLFPQYMMGSGPKPPAKAQAVALASLGADGSAMQREAFNAVKLLDDKSAVCAAIDADLSATAKQWALAADAVASMKDACVANLAKTIDFVLAKVAAGDDHLEILRRYDSVFDLDAPTRAKIAKAIPRRARRRPSGSARTSTTPPRSSPSRRRKSPSGPIRSTPRERPSLSPRETHPRTTAPPRRGRPADGLRRR